MTSVYASVDRAANGSDYGSDFDEEGEVELCQLLDDIEVRNSVSSFVLESIEEHERPNVAHVPTPPGSQPEIPLKTSSQDKPAVEVELDRGSTEPLSVPHDESAGKIQFESVQLDSESQQKDTRSPLQRFRTSPKKPLSVTDLVSPAWCELQYFYNLTKYGKVRRTPAMKQGSEVHKVLEEQVHQTVPVDVKTKEDHWGLRVWNIIQGLRTLRVTGMTRELELFGVLDGQVINGIIDELSYTCTDRELEAAIERVETKQTEHKSPPPDQTTLEEYFLSRSGNTFERGAKDAAKREVDIRRKVYITDIKTRGSSYLPKGVSLRPTYMQLMLYRKLLTEFAQNKVDAQQVFHRYGVNGSTTFSDSLIAQLSTIDFNFDTNSTQDTHAPVESANDVMDELLSHNSLEKIWTLMMEEFQKTFPQREKSLSQVLQAEFRNSRDGTIIGAKTFAHNDIELKAYLEDEMSWWKGEREAKGVDMEEAFKCGICEFAEGCTWRLTKVEHAVQKARAKNAAKRKSGV